MIFQSLSYDSEKEKEWDRRFISLAREVSTWSKDPSTKVGAVIVDDERRVVATGFNGFPRGVDDLAERYLSRETKYEMIIHAEANALLFAKRDLSFCTLYSTLMPCSRCAAMIIQSGIKRVVYLSDTHTNYAQNFGLSSLMFTEANVHCFKLGEEYYETH